MRRASTPGLLVCVSLALPGTAVEAATGAVVERYKWLTLAVFGAVIALTMFVTYVAAKRVKSASQFYAAGRSVSGVQNGWAIAGDYLSAASFLGVSGLISLYGFDGFMYSVGWLTAYITVLLVIAEPCRNIGKYTLGDILAFRNDPKAAKTMAATSTIVVSILYLTAQMVGGGVLVKTLVGIEYEVSLVAVGALMLAYVLFGGMIATTWVQIIKAALLVIASLLLVTLTWAPYGFSLPGFLEAVVSDQKVQARVASLIGDQATNMTPDQLGQRFLEPGLLFTDPVDQISLGMALVLGTAGMPHILMRFFTVPTARDARVSVLWAMAIIGGFYVLTLFLGSGAAINIGATKIIAMDEGGNMAGPLLAQYLGGGPDSMLGNFLLAFVAAVAFATIVAVVAGLLLAAASAMSHDIWVGIVKREHATQLEEVRAARISTIIVGSVAIIIGIVAKGQNVAHLVALAFAVAASSNLPCILLTLYWKRCNTGGIVLGMTVGAISAIALVLVSPNMTYPLAVRATNERAIQIATETIDKIGAERATATDATVQATLDKAIAAQEKAKAAARDVIAKLGDDRTSMVGLEEPLFDLRNPGLISIPLGFLCVLLGSLLYRDRRAEELWSELYVRQNTGIAAEAAVAR